jgi:S-DNA-T family DNA segregation ATPase FtsK/SpoIIIE
MEWIPMAKRKKASSSSVPVRTHLREICPPMLWAIALGSWLLLAAALASHDPADPLPAGTRGCTVAPTHPYAHNLIGPFGALLSHKLYFMIGPGIWIAMAGAVALMMTLALQRKPTQLGLRTAGVVVMTIITSALIGVSAEGTDPSTTCGLIALAINSYLRDTFNTFGAVVILVVAFWVGAILAMDQIVISASRRLGVALLTLRNLRIPHPVLVGRFPLPWRGAPERRRGQELFLRPSRRRGGAAAAGVIPDPDVPTGTALADGEDPSPEVEAQEDAPQASADPDDSERESEDSGGADAPGAYVAQKKFDPDALRAKIKQLPINFAPTVKSVAAPPREIDLSGYRFPGLDLLVEPESNFTQEMERMVRDQALQLEQALQQYRIDGEVVGIDSGPVITLFEVRLAAGTKVSTLNTVSSDLARALKAHNIRIVPNTAGKDTVGIEVPNLKKERVRLKELMTVNQEQCARMKLPMYLGKDASGTPLVADLTEMPHMLIAGTTGSGKSVCMNSIIMSFLFAKRPDELKLVLVDPKMVELSMFKDIPHLMCPVVTEMSKAAAILEWATTKMDERYELLAEAGVRDIAGYNQLTLAELKERFQPANEAEEARIPKKLPYLVFVVDELADLIITNKDVEAFIVRLAQKARAVGLHLILATQRPQANVVTGLIKGNMPCRVSFKVASGLDSRIVLDQKGAELLLGQGDMLYLSPRTSKLTRAQGTLVDDAEIRRVTAFLRDIAEQNFEPQLMQIRGSAVGEEAEENLERDPLFDEAVRIVLETKRGSVSLLQRRLNVGYSRASRLIEQMFRSGMLGDYKGSQAREVTMTLDEYEAIKAQAEADARAAAEAAPPGEAAADQSSDESDDDV